jgi:hypothetical protein
MSTATSVTVERYGWDQWVVVPSHSETHASEPGVVRYVWRARFAPHYAVSQVRAAFQGQEQAEQLARQLTRQNTPFG